MCIRDRFSNVKFQLEILEVLVRVQYEQATKTRGGKRNTSIASQQKGPVCTMLLCQNGTRNDEVAGEGTAIGGQKLIETTRVAATTRGAHEERHLVA